MREMAGSGCRSRANRPTNSAAICWASAALPPLPHTATCYTGACYPLYKRSSPGSHGLGLLLLIASALHYCAIPALCSPQAFPIFYIEIEAVSTLFDTYFAYIKVLASSVRGKADLHDSLAEGIIPAWIHQRFTHKILKLQVPEDGFTSPSASGSARA